MKSGKSSLKRRISILLAVALMATMVVGAGGVLHAQSEAISLETAISPTGSGTAEIYGRGDADNDKVFTQDDYDTLLSISNDLQEEPEAGSLEFYRHDFDMNDMINSADITAVGLLNNKLGGNTYGFIARDTIGADYKLNSIKIYPNDAATAETEITSTQLPTEIGNTFTAGDYTVKKISATEYWVYSGTYTIEVGKNTKVEFIHAATKSAIPNLQTEVSPAEAGTSAIYARGDIDHDGIIGEAEANTILSVSNGETSAPTATSLEFHIMDFDTTGAIDASDASECKRYGHNEINGTGFVSTYSEAANFKLTKVEIYLNDATEATVSTTDIPANAGDKVTLGAYTLEKTDDTNFWVYNTSGIGQSERGKVTKVVYGGMYNGSGKLDLTAKVTPAEGGSATIEAIGNVDRNKWINAQDMTVILQVINGTRNMPQSNTTDFLLHDMNFDGVITEEDTNLIHKFINLYYINYNFVAEDKVSEPYELKEIHIYQGGASTPTTTISKAQLPTGTQLTATVGNYTVEYRGSDREYRVYSTSKGARLGANTTVEFVHEIPTIDIPDLKAIVTPAEAGTAAIYARGDLNKDGKIDRAEAYEILKVSVDINPEPSNRIDWEIMDLNGNNKIQAADSSTVLRYIAGNTSSVNYISTFSKEADYELTGINIYRNNSLEVSVSTTNIPANIGDEVTFDSYVIEKIEGNTYWVSSKDDAGAEAGKTTFVEYVTKKIVGGGTTPPPIVTPPVVGPVTPIVGPSSPESVSVALRGNKTLSGDMTTQDITAGQFTFSMIADKYNDKSGYLGADTPVWVSEDGPIYFGNIIFLKAGTYKFTITENNLGKPGYTYDDAVYDVQILVTKNIYTNKLESAVTITENGKITGIVFENTYKKPLITEKIEKEVPDKEVSNSDDKMPNSDVPKTGDDANTMILVLLMILSVTGLTITLLLAKNKRN